MLISDVLRNVTQNAHKTGGVVPNALYSLRTEEVILSVNSPVWPLPLAFRSSAGKAEDEEEERERGGVVQEFVPARF